MTDSLTPRWQVSFVIPAMNEEVFLAAALDSIRRLRQRDDIRVAEVLVVDSGSVDATPDIARAAGCRVLPAAPGNVSASRNLGAAEAVGNVLAFLDADCELPSCWLENTADELAGQDVVAAGMQMAEPADDAPWVERTWFQLAHRSTSTQTSCDADWLATFNLAVRADAFQSAGGFDESLITCEDVDLGYRLSQQGTLRMMHQDGVKHHGESRTMQEFFRREAWRARGGWRLLQYHGSSLREVISCLIPFVVIGSLLAIPATVWWISPAGLIGLLPLAALVLRRRPAWRDVPAAMVLQAVYCAARCRGMLRPAARVARPKVSAAALGNADHRPAEQQPSAHDKSPQTESVR